MIEIIQILTGRDCCTADRTPREIIETDEVFSPKSDRIGAEFRSGLINKPFQHIVSFQPAYPAQRSHRGRVGSNPTQYQMTRRNAVGPTQNLRQIMCHHPHTSTAQIGAVSPISEHPQCQKVAIAIQRQLAM